MATQEAVEEDIDFKNRLPCGLPMIKAHWPTIFLIRSMIIPPYEANWVD